LGKCIEILYRINIFDLRETSVACAVGPSVNTLLIFSYKPNFCNSFEFQQQNPLKNQYLPHLSSEIFEINSSRAFQ
jgi:hypothetical protein